MVFMTLEQEFCMYKARAIHACESNGINTTGMNIHLLDIHTRESRYVEYVKFEDTNTGKRYECIAADKGNYPLDHETAWEAHEYLQ